MTANEINNCDNFIISIRKFLSHYYYISGEDFNKLSHESFMEIFGLKAISTKNIKLDEVISGEVVLVTDTYGRVFGYRNPLIIKMTEENEDFFITNVSIDFEEETYSEIDMNSLAFEKLSDYELDRLLMISKKLKDERVKHRIIKELRFRPESKPGGKKSLIEKVRKREFIRDKGEIKND